MAEMLGSGICHSANTISILPFTSMTLLTKRATGVTGMSFVTPRKVSVPMVVTVKSLPANASGVAQWDPSTQRWPLDRWRCRECDCLPDGRDDCCRF